ncbi:MAG: DUF998 domain-containing protein [Candidatus Diapherotrites archaeon]|nr:DUF998 domain-containing protein [Candidatus Diapherotrites archaeon]
MVFKMDLRRWFGLIGVAVFVVFTLIAISVYPNYGFFSQFLSELGEMGKESALWFNWGVVLSGLCFAVFFADFWARDRVFAACAVMASLGLLAVGIFPLPMQPHHTFAAVLFFLSAALAAAWFGKMHAKADARVAIVALLVALVTVLHVFVLLPLTQKIAVFLLLAGVLWVSFVEK